MVFSKTSSGSYWKNALFRSMSFKEYREKTCAYDSNIGSGLGIKTQIIVVECFRESNSDTTVYMLRAEAYY